MLEANTGLILENVTTKTQWFRCRNRNARWSCAALDVCVDQVWRCFADAAILYIRVLRNDSDTQGIRLSKEEYHVTINESTPVGTRLLTLPVRSTSGRHLGRNLFYDIIVGNEDNCFAVDSSGNRSVLVLVSTRTAWAFTDTSEHIRLYLFSFFFPLFSFWFSAVD